MRLETPIGREKDYLEYWTHHPELMKERKLNDLLGLLENLEATHLVSLTEEFYAEVDKLRTTNFKRFSICPSVGIHYDIPIKQARKLDNDQNELAVALFERMREGLNLVLPDTSQILKDPKDLRQRL